jgi:flagellar biosynthesis component FlhA
MTLTLPLVFYILATICFLLVTFGASRINWMTLGFAFLTMTLWIH